MSKDKYKEVVSKLNSLQSNATTIHMMRSKRLEMARQNLAETHFYLGALKITTNDIDSLRPIHVTGTKGKGSTCAFLESILRSNNLKTGFYSSPHLVHVCERIRINGIPLTETQFIHYFNLVYDTVKSASESQNVPMPAYFKFLTLMSFYVCIKEKVDVMVVEVGIGGEHDCTNVIENPVVCGITVLDVDHTNLLGNTLEEIAWHKAGIIKKHRPVITVIQNDSALKVIKERANEKKGTLLEMTPFSDLHLTKETLEFVDSIGLHQQENIALAISLAKVWFTENGIHNLEKERLEKAIRETRWAGRSQVLEKGNITFYLDGAHTTKSIKCCSEWFNYKLELEKLLENGHPSLRILLFQCTGDREPTSLLSILLKENEFNYAIFTSTRLYQVVDNLNDNTNLNTSDQAQKQKCEQSKEAWKEIMGNDNVTVADCIEESLLLIHQLAANNKTVKVLVTGSLHLVGGVLSFEGE
ncbi:unnamed protein product [Bursaphelenchus xylophilus]|uniref:Folylpolyglutamate synthase n=1 Tax=Bursaphelenchus xylophilus TaxID=6326 RepID=A0A1I7SMA2_BURXY|nr:unnamed protein product [Bursaphelenchus xylophilus]CAG9130068.1 unnamed protein product [Bursaphelenchus xylophilus]